MSFTELKLPDLKKVADSFGVDISDIKSKNEVVARLQEEGITWQMYDKFNNAEKEEIIVPAKQEKKKVQIMNKENSVLVKMERSNHSYQAIGYTFTDQHPFVAMPEQHAQQIFDTQSGFRLATPREAQEFYS